MNNKGLFVVLLILAVHIWGCTLSGPVGPINGKLDRSGAARLISNSRRFKEPAEVTVTAVWGKCEELNRSKTVENRMLLGLQQLGLISLTTVPGNGSILSNDSCRPALTEEGKREATQWKTKDAPPWAIPLANREITEVTGITGGDKEDAIVYYAFKWVPNALCQRLKPVFEDDHLLLVNPDHPERAEAHFKKYDDGWRLIE